MNPPYYMLRNVRKHYFRKYFPLQSMRKVR